MRYYAEAFCLDIVTDPTYQDEEEFLEIALVRCLKGHVIVIPRDGLAPLDCFRTILSYRRDERLISPDKLLQLQIVI